MASNKRALLVAPMPYFPSSAGNRKRAVDLAVFLRESGYRLDLAITDHEDQIYRSSGQHAPNDMASSAALADRLFYIETSSPRLIKTYAHHYLIDDWYPVQVDQFMDWYFSHYPEVAFVIVNYVFLSRALERVPAGCIKLIDTHDRFSNRDAIYKITRGEPGFFYTSEAEEAKALDRADAVLAIQDDDAEFFRSLTSKPVYTLGHLAHSEIHSQSWRLPFARKRRPPSTIWTFGFVGHGNDANIFAIRSFAFLWQQTFPNPGGPILRIAGEVCSQLQDIDSPNVEVLGYVDDISEFYSSVDAIIAPLTMGTGLKIKVIEGLMYSKIVIGTKTAFEGIQTDAQIHTFNDQKSMMAFLKQAPFSTALIEQFHAVCELTFTRYVKKIETDKQALLRLFKASARKGLSASMSPMPSPGESIPRVPDQWRIGDTPWRIIIEQRYVGSTHSSVAPTARLIACERRDTRNRFGLTGGDDFSPLRGHVFLARDIEPHLEGDFITEDWKTQLEQANFVPVPDKEILVDGFGTHQNAMCEVFHLLVGSTPDWISRGALVRVDIRRHFMLFRGPTSLVRRKELPLEITIKRADGLVTAARAPKIEWAPTGLSALISRGGGSKTAARGKSRVPLLLSFEQDAGTADLHMPLEAVIRLGTLKGLICNVSLAKN